jgi:hypothetical protein
MPNWTESNFSQEIKIILSRYSLLMHMSCKPDLVQYHRCKNLTLESSVLDPDPEKIIPDLGRSGSEMNLKENFCEKRIKLGNFSPIKLNLKI